MRALSTTETMSIVGGNGNSAARNAAIKQWALVHSSSDRPAQSQSLGVVTAKVDPAVEA